MANQFLGLALFIMLLSFFIVLNTLSNFEDMKSRPVLNSLAMAFSSKEVGDGERTSYEDTVKESFKKGSALDNINSLFEAQVTGFESKQNRFGTKMHVRLPLRQFEKAVIQSAQVPGQMASTSGNFFMPTLVSLLRAEETQVPYRMDMLVNVPASPSRMQNEQPSSLKNPITKAGMLAQILETAGLPKKLYSTGLAQGKEGYVDIYFRRYEPFDPLGNRESDESEGG